MTYYTDYLEEISARKKQGLHAKPIDNHSLMEEIIQQIKDDNNVYRKDSLHFFIYNTLRQEYRGIQYHPIKINQITTLHVE